MKHFFEQLKTWLTRVLPHFLSELKAWLDSIFTVLGQDPDKQQPNTQKPTPTKPSQRPSKIPTQTDTKTDPKTNDTGGKTGGKNTPSVIGYDPDFLGVEIPLPKITLPKDALLHYLHFSIGMNKDRRMPFYTAVNIDALSYNKLKSQIPSRKEIGEDDWELDLRLDKAAQLPKSFYRYNDFDLGHMVRREDAIWGETLEEALKANDDTFFLTNATPQHKDFNRSAERWKGLEDYALKHARKNDLRLTVFTGCIFTEKDRLFAKVKIPARFWKIMVMVKENGTPSATGYIVHQDDLIEDITEQSLFYYEQFKTYQVDLKTIEEATGIKFGLNAYDPLQRRSRQGLVANQPILVEDAENIEF
jgi:DNA/RNA endonuclease G (NUC1)